jgi:hypothetical protein
MQVISKSVRTLSIINFTPLPKSNFDVACLLSVRRRPKVFMSIVRAKEQRPRSVLPDGGKPDAAVISGKPYFESEYIYYQAEQ